MTIKDTDWNNEYKEWLKQLGRAIAKIRKERGMTQMQMAVLTNFDFKYYQDLEYGRRAVTTRTLWQLCEGLGMKLNQLVLCIAEQERK